jgi:hypothetical protein
MSLNEGSTESVLPEPQELFKKGNKD